MPATITFFPVDNGDMTLLTLESGTRILIDTNIREPKEAIRDVAADLRKRLKTDSKKRPYVDVFLLSHPDQDHCRGLQEHFHLGPLADYPETDESKEPKIIIREMWSSPMVFRRASKNHTLCDDAKAWNAEARRRVEHFRQNSSAEAGDRILILGEDEDGKTDDLQSILIKTDEQITTVNGQQESSLRTLLLAPSPKGKEEEEEARTKNHSSVIIRFSFTCENTADACRFLTGGDAEVAIWERLWKKHKKSSANLAYDLMLTPHHCSWRTLSYDSWSDLGEKVTVSQDARSALGQAQPGAFIVASSKIITDEDNDPPCVRAKREYCEIAKSVKGQFLNTAEHPTSKNPAPMEFEITTGGPMLKKDNTEQAKTSLVIGRQPLMHG